MKQKILLTFCVVFLLVSCGSVEKHNLQVTKLHPVEDLHEDVDKVYEQLQRNHPHLYQFASKEILDFKFDSLKHAITEPMDSRTFYKQLAAVTKYVGQGHMSLSPPSKRFTKKERKALNKTKFDINNLDFDYLDDKLFIVNARGNDSVLINAEVLKVEDEKPQDLIRDYTKVIASDGFNTTFHQRVAGNRFMGYYAKDKGRFDSITLTLRNSDSTFVKMYKRVLKKDTTNLKKDSISLDTLSLKKKKKIRLTKAEKKTKKLERKAKRKHNAKFGYIAARDEYTRNLNFIGKDSSVALLKIRGFSNNKYEAFYDESFKAIDSLKADALIIDLRNNFGGRLKEITYLYTYLTDKDFVMINPSEVKTRFPILKSLMANSTPNSLKVLGGVLSPILATMDALKSSKKDGKLYYKFKSSKAQEANPLNYKGKIYVLINGNSFSASSLLSTKLRGDNRATFVGEETGGAFNGTVAGLYKIYEAPNTKVRARIGLAHIDAPNKVTPDGYGIIPDVEIIPTYKDRLNNVDPELEWVLEDLEGKH
ncbi:S41 family peptidase [uncultured Winogradskyella sp.]|uniref:S41 family peptidase n=1 Tax=uncultured Winogradskyella sp. TaxID=395353 RepID=UPI0030EF9869|tara:strand:+ start:2162 stop:3769 length:1608 start_codon:yes stop_codon:yes gene_type:complete